MAERGQMKQIRCLGSAPRYKRLCPGENKNMRIELQVAEGTLTFVDVRQGLLQITNRHSPTATYLQVLPVQALERLRVGREVKFLIKRTSESRLPEVLAAQQAPESRLVYFGASMAWHILAVGIGLLVLAFYLKSAWLFLPVATTAVLLGVLAARRARTLRIFSRLLAANGAEFAQEPEPSLAHDWPDTSRGLQRP
jgi:hypothetical protein